MEYFVIEKICGKTPNDEILTEVVGIVEKEEIAVHFVDNHKGYICYRVSDDKPIEKPLTELSGKELLDICKKHRSCSFCELDKFEDCPLRKKF